MTNRLETLTRPSPAVSFTTRTRHRTIGFGLAFVGLLLAVVPFIANIAAANTADPETAARTLAWSFGLTTTAFAFTKIAIAVILVGILVRLWLRIDSVRTALTDLKPHAEQGSIRTGDIETEFGAATVSTTAPESLPIHRMASTMWAPMLAMGAMAVAAGLVVSFVWAGNVGTETGADTQAWTQGLQFLGEGMILAGISFLLGSILKALREGGGELQQSLGVKVVTLKMPATAKAFIGLMMLGLMISILQFVLYVVVAASVDNAQSFSAWLAWLGPLRELGLGLILSGIVLSLVTIGTVLRFQFNRIREIATTGR